MFKIVILKFYQKYALAIKACLLVMLTAYFIFLNSPDGLLFRELSCIIWGDMDRHALLYLYDNLEPGINEDEFLRTYREISPRHLDFVPSRGGYDVFERADLLYTFWKLQVLVEDGMIVAVQVRDVDNGMLPTNAPADKHLLGGMEQIGTP